MSVISFHYFTYFHIEEWWTRVTNTQAPRVPSWPALVLPLLIRRRC